MLLRGSKTFSGTESLVRSENRRHKLVIFILTSYNFIKITSRSMGFLSSIVAIIIFQVINISARVMFIRL